MFGRPKLKHLTDEKLILIPSTTLVYMPEASVRNKDLDADQKVTGLSVRQCVKRQISGEGAQQVFVGISRRNDARRWRIFMQ